MAFGRNDEENCEKGKPEQLIGGSQGSRVYSTNGTAVTQCSGSGGLGGKTGLYFIDYNSPPNITDTARCITARQDSGISHHKGEHSAVFCDLNENPQITENARCLHTRMDLGVTNGKHKGERSGILIEDMWGGNWCYQLGNGNTEDSLTPIKIMDNVKSVVLGSSHNAAINKDGSLFMWGYNDRGQIGNTVQECGL